MVNTGWKCPLVVTQDDRREVNKDSSGATHACYSFNDLKNIVKDDFSYAYIPTSGGIDDIRASPVIYAYNYNFNIPSNATIKKIRVLPIFQQSNGKGYGWVTKIKTIKLKTGSSTTDYGIGNNLANKDFISSLTLSIQQWTTEKTFTKGNEYVLEGGKDVWDVELTPSLVNSTNFGFVFQVVGTKNRKWVNPYVAKLLMDIEYDLSGQTTTDGGTGGTKCNTKFYFGDTEIVFGTDNISTTSQQLDITKPSIYKEVTVKHRHTGRASESPTLILESTGLLLTDSKKKTYTLPTIHFNSDTNETVYTQSFRVYPNTKNGTQYVVIKANYGDKSASRLLKFNVVGELFTSFSGEDLSALVEKGQYCKILSSIFKNNTAKLVKNNTTYGKGGAMYILSELFKYQWDNSDTNVYENNVAGITANNLYWNDNNMDES